MGKKAVRILILQLAGAFGCALAGSESFRPDPLPLGRGLPTFEASSVTPENPGAPTAPIVAGDVSVSQAFAMALLHNPGLAAYSWDLRVKEAERLQAGLRLNPELLLDVEDFAGTGEHAGIERSQTTLQVGQTFELGDKRSARLKAASRSLQKAGWEYEAKRLEILQEVSLAFVEVVGAQRGLALAEDAVRLADKTAETLGLRARAGRASVVEEAKVKVAATNARIDLEWAKHRLEEARKGLAALWGQAEPSFSSAKDGMDSLTTLPAFDTLVEQLRQHPRLAALSASIAAEQATADLEKANRSPNLTLRGGYRRLAASDDNALVAGISMPLPLLNKNQGRILEARHRKAKTGAERQAAEIELRGMLAEAFKVAFTAAVEINLLRTSVLPGVEAASESVTQGYNQGRYGYLEVLDAQKTLVTSRLQYLRALMDHHRAVAKLESLTGRPLNPSSMERKP